MVNDRAKSAGSYVMRLVGGVAVILGVLMVFSTLAQGSLIGAALGVVFIAGGAYLVRRSGGFSRS
jgi:uncharacterized membrane protein HdeD (DUF308 family)